MHFFNENVQIWTRIPINDIIALLQVMAWRWPGNKPLSAASMISFFDANLRHSASKSYAESTMASVLKEMRTLLPEAGISGRDK